VGLYARVCVCVCKCGQVCIHVGACVRVGWWVCVYVWVRVGACGCVWVRARTRVCGCVWVVEGVRPCAGTLPCRYAPSQHHDRRSRRRAVVGLPHSVGGRAPVVLSNPVVVDCKVGGCARPGRWSVVSARGVGARTPALLFLPSACRARIRTHIHQHA